MGGVRVVGNYELGKTLGIGGFAKVKHGVNTTTGEVVAVKIVSKERLRRKGHEQQMLMEIGITRLLSHEHVIQFTDVFQSERFIFLVMDYLTGGDLLDHLQEAQGVGFGEARSRRYFQQITLALMYCHGQGVAHRDIKPENVLLDTHDCIRLADFGMACLQDRADNMCGSPNYVAPEILLSSEGGSYRAEATDVWSAGVLLYAMLAGELPFDDAHDDERIFDMICQGRYVMPKCFTCGAKELVRGILVTDPAHRATLDEIAASPWLREGGGPDAAKLEEALRPRTPPPPPKGLEDMFALTPRSLDDSSLEETVGLSAWAASPSSMTPATTVGGAPSVSPMSPMSTLSAATGVSPVPGSPVSPLPRSRG